jgi:hypothetical protein
MKLLGDCSTDCHQLRPAARSVLSTLSRSLPSTWLQGSSTWLPLTNCGAGEGGCVVGRGWGLQGSCARLGAALAAAWLAGRSVLQSARASSR